MALSMIDFFIQDDTHVSQAWERVDALKNQMIHIIMEHKREGAETDVEHIFDFYLKPRAVASIAYLTDREDAGLTWDDLRPHAKRTYREVFDQWWADLNREIEQSIYFYFWSIDCDQCESDSVVRFKSWYSAAEYIKDFYDGAEGRCSVEQMDLQGYINYQPYRRDHRAEQYNY